MKAFKRWLAGVLVKWAHQLAHDALHHIISAPKDDPALLRAQELVFAANHEAASGTSGEFKRHQVLARLQKEFPDLRERRLAQLIELAVEVVA